MTRYNELANATPSNRVNIDYYQLSTRRSTNIAFSAEWQAMHCALHIYRMRGPDVPSNRLSWSQTRIGRCPAPRTTVRLEKKTPRALRGMLSGEPREHDNCFALFCNDHSCAEVTQPEESPPYRQIQWRLHCASSALATSE